MFRLGSSNSCTGVFRAISVTIKCLGSQFYFQGHDKIPRKVFGIGLPTSYGVFRRQPALAVQCLIIKRFYMITIILVHIHVIGHTMGHIVLLNDNHRKSCCKKVSSIRIFMHD